MYILGGDFVTVTNILLGLVLLLLGRKLFWAFVGILGFLAGFNYAHLLFGAQPDWFIPLIAVACGVLGVLLAIFFQKVALAVAGFLAGGYLAGYLVYAAGFGAPTALPGVAAIIGGIIGAVLMVVLFDWGLILLSCLAGSSLIVRSVMLGRATELILFFILAAAGFMLQARLWRPRTPETGRRLKT